jgi:hypothetical protein
MTGYRRAKDAVIQFVDGLKRAWNSDAVKNDPRIIMVLRVLTQSYAFTWDPDLRALAEATTDLFYDPETELALTQQRPNLRNSWKTETDVAALIEAWEIFFTPRYYEMAMKTSRFWWYHLIGSLPNNTHLGYTNPMGQIGNFLYRETGDASIPAALDFHIRWGATGYNPETQELAYYAGRESANVVFIFRGIPYAQDILARCDAGKQTPASWVAYQDEGAPVSILILKEEQEAVELTVRSPQEDAHGVIDEHIRVRLLGKDGLLGPDLTRIWGGSALADRIRIPKDAAKGVYEILPAHCGIHFVVANSRASLVIHAPSGWRPLVLRPPVKVYFDVPEGVRNAQIHFEGSARLFEPGDNPFQNGELMHGCVDLPNDSPGLWSFGAVDNGLIQVNNIPPFFAMGDPGHYFSVCPEG